MTISFIVNGEDAVIRCEAGDRLLDILRGSFGLPGTKAGCLCGRCGACYVILNGKVVPSCLVPAFRLPGSEVITIEGFSQDDGYADIAAGFSQAGVECCGFCDSGKVLIAASLLDRRVRPSREEILSSYTGIRCRCTEPESLVDGVLAAADIRQRRLYGRSASN
jgi:carbon-monoxide dehydrogenase small subunit